MEKSPAPYDYLRPTAAAIEDYAMRQKGLEMMLLERRLVDALIKECTIKRVAILDSNTIEFCVDLEKDKSFRDIFNNAGISVTHKEYLGVYKNYRKKEGWIATATSYLVNDEKVVFVVANLEDRPSWLIIEDRR